MSKILLIGDHCIDEYRYGTVDRISPEAPVPVFKFSHMDTKPGMAGNVRANLIAFGCDVEFITSAQPSTKTRLIDIHSKQHILRIDDDVPGVPLAPNYQENLNEFDAIVFSDYLKGFVSYELIKWTRANFNGPIFIDTKKRDLAQFEGCYVKVNEQEYNQRTSVCNNLIVTLGANGAMFRHDEYEDFFPGNPVEVVDVCGAGDTFISALVYKFLETKDMPIAIFYANKASSIAVQHSGVYTLSFDEIKSIII